VREVVVATNGYNRRPDAAAEAPGGAGGEPHHRHEELPEHASSLIPELRAVGDTARADLFRPSPDGKRLIFGGRAASPQRRPR